MSRPTELVITSPDGMISRHKFTGKAHIGRNPHCEVVLNDPMCSRQHCIAERDADGRYFVSDLNSANGTQVNGTLITGRTQLKKGDILVVGATLVELVVREEKTVFIIANTGSASGETDTILGAPFIKIRPVPPSPIKPETQAD